jgi:hypothetical protein
MPKLNQGNPVLSCTMDMQFNDMHKKLDLIMQKMQTLDVIEKQMARLDGKINSLENRIGATEKTKNIEFQQPLDFVSSMFDEFWSENKEISEITKTVTKQKKKLNSDIDGRYQPEES